MGNLISLNNVCLAYGLNPLLDNIKLNIENGERVCLIGRNGEGKSSLLKIIAAESKADSGEVWRAPELRIARLEQELPQQSTATVYEFVAQGLENAGTLLADFYKLTHSFTEQDLKKLETLQKQIDACDGWRFEQQINAILTRLNLSADKLVTSLSGGWQRRVALAKALVINPDLLLLDEPTNHLDIEAIQWLEDELLAANTGILFITHDRALLQRLATRIIELDRGQLTSWPGDYANFLRRKQEMLHAEEKQNSEFDKKLAQEERWIRQGIKARRTRNEGRVRALKTLRIERNKRRELQGTATFKINSAEQSGKIVVDIEHISHGYAEKTLIKDFSLRVMRGDRIGLIGPNGIGKSTLLNILLAELKPQQGTVTHGTKLQIAYFDQLRQSLDPEKTVLDNVSQGREMIEINGKNQHIMSYLSDFLFSPQRAFTPVKALSGGECNRLVLARLFSQPSNLLVLDEPTNDLDIETLELLEELLMNYQGTLLLVSHDREFLDNVVTSVLVFKGEGIIEEHVGGYQDWQQKIKKTLEITEKSQNFAQKSESPIKPNRKIGYKEQRELAALPAKIEQLEKQQHELQQLISDPAFYQKSSEEVTKKLSEIKTITDELNAAYRRWEELES